MARESRNGSVPSASVNGAAAGAEHDADDLGDTPFERFERLTRRLLRVAKPTADDDHAAPKAPVRSRD